jgi:hypothetical protein
MSISGSGLDFKNTIFNRQDGNIESSTTKIEDEDIAFSTNLLTTKTLVIKIVGKWKKVPFYLNHKQLQQQ